MQKLFFPYSVFLSVLNLLSVCGTGIQYAAVPCQTFPFPEKRVFPLPQSEKWIQRTFQQDYYTRKKEGMQAEIKILFRFQKSNCHIINISSGGTGDNQAAGFFQCVESVVVFQNIVGR